MCADWGRVYRLGTQRLSCPVTVRDPEGRDPAPPSWIPTLTSPPPPKLQTQHVSELPEADPNPLLHGHLPQAVQLFRAALAQFDPPASPPSPPSATDSDASTGPHPRAPPPGLGLGRCHILRTRLRAALLKALIEEGREWQGALLLARELSSSYETVSAPPGLLCLCTLEGSPSEGGVTEELR